MRKLTQLGLLLALIVIATAMSIAAATYAKIPGVPQSVNDLGAAIAAEQTAVVTPGGTEYAPKFSDADETSFEKSGKLAKIVARVAAEKVFADGVVAIQNLPQKTREKVWTKFLTPVYPTWGMNGKISDAGTTNAGYSVQTKIATALTDMTKAYVAVADFGYQIRSAQMEVVTPGGTEYAPKFSDEDKAKFDKSDKLSKIVEKFTGAETFPGNVAAFKSLTDKSQATAFEKFNVPVYPTWGMNGKISNAGTTGAGYEVQKAIIAEMVKALKAALK
jgi:hypothetical protein